MSLPAPVPASDPRVADAMGLVQGRAYEMTMRELGVAFGAASPEGRDRLAAAERRALAATLALPRVDCARWNPEEHRM